MITKDVPAEFFDTDVLAIDLETTGLDPLQDRVLLISLSNGRQTIVSDTGTWFPRLWETLKQPDIVMIAHNAAFDLRFLWQLGFDGYPTAIWDTLLAEQVLTAGTFVKCDLEKTAFRRAGRLIDKSLRKTFIGFRGSEFTPRQIQYAHDDVGCLISIMEAQAALCKSQGLLETVELENRLVPVTAKMEHVGIGFDVDAWQKLVVRERKLAAETSQKVQRLLQLDTYSYDMLSRSLGGINLNSHEQVRSALSRIGIDIPNTQEETLKKYIATHPKAIILELFLKYKKCVKQIGFAYDKYIHPVTGRIHSHFRQLGAVSGRYSSSGPNLQNIPIRTELGKQIRRCWISQSGWKLIQADYSQQEMRGLAQASGDKNLIEICRHSDPHGENAKRLYGDNYTKEQRRTGKNTGFAMAYGATAKKVAQTAAIPLREAKQLIEYTMRTFPDVARYATKLIIFANEHGYVVTLGGRRRYFQRTSDNKETFWDNEIRNHPIQGCLKSTTRILTSNGYQMIGDLWKKDTENLQVWTGTKFANFSVLNRGPCELATITLANGITLECDTRHEILVITNNGYKWKSFLSLGQGDNVCLSLPQEIDYGSIPKVHYEYVPKNHNGLPLTITELNEQFFYWLGYHYGDGWIAHNPDDYRWHWGFSFGGDKISKDRIKQCVAFFSGMGLRPTVRELTPTKYTVKIHSKGLIEFLEQIGIDTHANVHTKRLPQLVFSLPIHCRKSFLCGMMDADGCAGKTTAYVPNIHLCQKELLQDLWLLFRTVGVQGKIRGPYHYKRFTSYRLDLIGDTLYSSLSYGIKRNKSLIFGLLVPPFLVDEFLRAVPNNVLLRKHSESYRVLYQRLRSGESVSVYTLKDMLRVAKAEIVTPLYVWSSVVDIAHIGIVEDTYTVAVDDELHCFDSMGIISKNTAVDMIKRAMVGVDTTLREENYRARIVLQVHDELIVEAPDEEVMAVKSIVVREMESAGKYYVQCVPTPVDVSVETYWKKE